MVKVFDDLIKDVTTPGYCLACGACVASCPHECLAMKVEKPDLIKKCLNCGICYEECPQVIDQRELGPKIFGTELSGGEALGTYRQALAVEAKSPDIKASAQDGGAVTAILASLLEGGFIDGAIVMGIGPLPWQPSPKVARTREELIACAGTKYARGSPFLALKDAVDLHYCSRVAIVGTPCQIAASRRMQLSELTNRHLGETIKLHIGLFCMHAFEYEKFFRGIIEKQTRTPLSEVVKFDIKRGRFIIYRRNKPRRELALEAVEKYSHFPCKVCFDYTAELADISVGSVGSPLGQSTVLIRTQVGTEAFDAARRFRGLNVLGLEEVKPGIKVLGKVSREKKSRAARELERLRLLGKTLPVWWQAQPPAPKEEEPSQSIAQP